MNNLYPVSNVVRSESGSLSPISTITSSLDDVSKRLSKSGIEMVPYSTANIQKLRLLPQAKILSIMEQCLVYSSLIRDICCSGSDFQNPNTVMWRILKGSGLACPNELFGYLKRDDVVEIYNCDHTQLIANFSYFSVSSYTLLELIEHTWEELYEHERDHSTEFFRVAEGIFSGQLKEIVHFDLPYTKSTERFSERQFEVSGRPKLISPLWDREDKSNRALLVAWEMELVAEKTESAVPDLSFQENSMQPDA